MNAPDLAVPGPPPIDLLAPTDLPAGISLFLDFDGTLVELAERPDAVLVEQRAVAAVAALHRLMQGRVALISGRPVAEVRAFLGTDATIVGSHGLEFGWRDARPAPLAPPAGLEPVGAAMDALAAGEPGLLVERKPLGVALHYRQCPHAEPRCLALAAELAARHGLQLQPGKMMIEVRAGGGDKGSALRTLMREPDMAGTRPVFMGDDLTDEPGFVAAAELGGAGILIGPARATTALYRLPGVPAALGWLEAAAARAA